MYHNPKGRRKGIFPIRFPIAKRLFDFWFKLFETLFYAALLTVLSYLKYGNILKRDDLVNLILLLVALPTAYMVLYWLTDNEAWISRKDD